MESGLKRIAYWTAVLVIACGIAFLGIRGCAFMPWNRASTEMSVTITVTRDYGETVLEREVLNLGEDASVMEALRKTAEVETAYGGGFVEDVDGIGKDDISGREMDWFYYVNGVLADVGASDYNLQPGDEVWWDYHLWGCDTFIGAVIGQYPRPFTVGYGDGASRTKIINTAALAEQAKRVMLYLRKEGAEVSLSEDVRGFDFGDREGPVIAILNAEDADSNTWLQDRLKTDRGSGMFFMVEDGNIELIDETGNKVDGVDPKCAIGCTSDGLGDPKPVMFVICDEERYAADAADILTDMHPDIQGFYSAYIDDTGSVRRLPHDATR